MIIDIKYFAQPNLLQQFVLLERKICRIQICLELHKDPVLHPKAVILFQKSWGLMQCKSVMQAKLKSKWGRMLHNEKASISSFHVWVCASFQADQYFSTLTQMYICGNSNLFLLALKIPRNQHKSCNVCKLCL